MKIAPPVMPQLRTFEAERASESAAHDAHEEVCGEQEVRNGVRGDGLKRVGKRSRKSQKRKSEEVRGKLHAQFDDDERESSPAPLPEMEAEEEVQAPCPMSSVDDVLAIAGDPDRSRRAANLKVALANSGMRQARATAARALLRDPAALESLDEDNLDALAAALSHAPELSNAEFRARETLFASIAHEVPADQAHYLTSSDYARRLQAYNDPKARSGLHGQELVRLGKLDRSVVERAHHAALARLSDRSALETLKDCQFEDLKSAAQSLLDRLYLSGRLTGVNVDDDRLAHELADALFSGCVQPRPEDALHVALEAATDDARDLIEKIEAMEMQPSTIASLGAIVEQGAARGLAEGYALARRHLDRTSPKRLTQDLDEGKLNGLTALGTLNGWSTFGQYF